MSARSVAIAALAAATVALGVAAVLVDAAPGVAATPATIEHYAFSPADLTVHVGDTVTWTNLDEAPHTVTSSSGPTAIDSPQLNKGQSFAYTFTTAGTWQYYCAIHPDMKGVVHVVPAASSGVPTTPSPPLSAKPAPQRAAPAAPAAPPNPAAAPARSPHPGPDAASMPAMSPAAGCSATAGNANALDAMVAPFFVHFDKAHLEESPGQQANDLLNLNQYVKTHTVLVEAMVAPLFATVESALLGVNPFLVHLDKAHLEESPGQQANDLLNVNQYVKTHTVLVEAMTAPATSTLEGTSGC
jgi:plastocyanin